MGCYLPMLKLLLPFTYCEAAATTIANTIINVTIIFPFF